MCVRAPPPPTHTHTHTHTQNPSFQVGAKFLYFSGDCVYVQNKNKSLGSWNMFVW